jgi:hypothetical protein
MSPVVKLQVILLTLIMLKIGFMYLVLVFFLVNQLCVEKQLAYQDDVGVGLCRMCGPDVR